MVLYILGLLYIVIGVIEMIHHLKKVYKYHDLDEVDVIISFMLMPFWILPPTINLVWYTCGKIAKYLEKKWSEN